jgi:AraC-like DNA-binding protein
MQPATAKQFAASPVGRYVAGAGYVHFCAAAELWGVLLWGRPSLELAEALERTLTLELEPPARPHASIVDASGLTGVDVNAFGALNAYVRGNFDRLKAQVRRLALVRPSGMEGALVAGFFEVMPPPYPVSVFSERAPALEWALADTTLDAAQWTHSLTQLFDLGVGTAPIVRELEAYLVSDLHAANVSDAARILGLSERTLQRRLSEAGTTFVDALSAARVRVAQRLMLDSDAALTRIALDVGCASLQHFSALFRRKVGEAPSVWRAKQKA